VSAPSRPRLSVVTEPGATTDRAGDDAIVEGLRAGRVDALAVAFDRWHVRVRVLVRWLLSDPASAEDVV